MDSSCFIIIITITGLEGGFQTDEKKFKFEEHNSVVVLPDWKIFPLIDQNLPDIVSCISVFMNHLMVWIEIRCQSQK